MRKILHAISNGPFILCAWFFLVLADLRLRLVPYQKNRNYLEPHSTYYKKKRRRVREKLRSKQEIMQIIQTTRWRVLTAANFPLFFTMNCLRKALALRKILAYHGIEAWLEYGVAKKNESLDPQLCHGNFSAHAWIQVKLPDGTSVQIETVGTQSTFAKLSTQGYEEKSP